MPDALKSVGPFLKRLKSDVLSHDFILATVIGVCLIIGTLFLGLENNKVVPLNTDPAAHYLAEPSNPLRLLANWDGPDYLKIATHGYSSITETNFFPLYPLSIYVVKTIISSPLDAALIISWVCFILAIYYYLKLAKILFSLKTNAEALRAVALFVLFPTGI